MIMINNQLILKSTFRGIVAFAFVLVCHTSYAQVQVKVTALAVHSAGNIRYTYQLSNLTSSRNIYAFSIGNRGDKSDDPATQTNEQPELSVYPADSYSEIQPDEGDSRDVSLRLGGTFTSPQDWKARISEYEQTNWPGIESKFSIDWNIDENISANFPVIYPFQTFQFGVTVPKRDSSYLNSHFTVNFDDNENPGMFVGSIVPVDILPPTLSVTLTPATLWPPNNKPVQINAAITASDDYDPESEIKLESITANEALAGDDIQEAQLGADDRSFSLVAKREGTNPAGRIYTVTYSATDASGNKATASATVTVGHDQGK